MTYIDTSALVPMVVKETGSPRVLGWLSAQADAAASISAWTRTELVSAISGKVRVAVIEAEEATRALAWARSHLLPRFRVEPVEPADLAAAETLLERFELSLRAGDALHLAIVRRLGEPLLTLDRRMAAAADGLGLQLIEL
jgi:predicted nucleic acid-binding protein